MADLLDDETWDFSSIEDLNQEATLCLRSAMVYERRKRWQKAIDCYEKLLWLVDLKHLPSNYEAPPSYDMLLYELYNHLGVAYQHMGRHKKAMTQYTKAFEIVSIPKNGCLAGCVTNCCLMTPIMTRRAFAYTKIGNVASALKDAEKAVVLDSKNPDVYCIRALVRGSRDEENMALKDIDMALKINPKSVCALMIKSAITRPLAEKMNPSTQNFNSVTSFHHPSILEFFDRFFFTLSVPHTITEVNLRPVRSTRRQLDISEETKRPKTAQPRLQNQTCCSTSPEEPFRCGTAFSFRQSASATRRKEYGQAVRQYMTRPKTASDFIALIEKERKKKAEAAAKTSTTSQGFNSSVGNRKSLPNSRMSSSKAFYMEPQGNYTMPVFRPIDLKNSSRMYYKPWNGDKLPVADIRRLQPSPAFY
ncbi:uncharacterized protein LOC126828294 isoform X2 [Patella vulgata]|uniref:uncharacterized protein LOC126828294 isoform X2 n=1 Tax=Patella vulgata TaxID=6465 RepID=UPI00217F81D0|nr:uncharacterized protein LOC126828294 isoform X2 [Patella vulgata]